MVGYGKAVEPDIAHVGQRAPGFLNNMVSIPHVANMVCMKAFVGIMDQVPSSNLLVYTLLTDSCCIEMYIKW